LQGEGLHIGIPSIFVRFNNCNLKCSWCDSKYSWGWEEGKHDWQDVVKFIKDAPVYNHIIFTGGEPLLRENQEDVMKIIQNVMVADSRITIETNGTIKPGLSLQLLMKIRGLWSVSPKLQFIEKYTPAGLLWFDLQKNTQWKFVITDIEKDIRIIYSSLIEPGIITTAVDRPVVLQPNGQTPNYNTACRELAEYVINNNMTEFKVLPQFHKICWGNQRGI
jgi:7-carboxy-7-deazaguanine synthase